MATTLVLAAQVGISPACAALGMPRASFYRNRAPAMAPRPHAPGSPDLSLPLSAKQSSLSFTANASKIIPPIEVAATLLDEGQNHCSARTMYRLLAEVGQTRERRDQLVHPAYQKPELLASAPNSSGFATSPI